MQTLKHNDRFTVLSPGYNGIFVLATTAGCKAEWEAMYQREFTAPENSPEVFAYGEAIVVAGEHSTRWPDRTPLSFGDEVMVDGKVYTLVKDLNRSVALIPKSEGAGR